MFKLHKLAATPVIALASVVLLTGSATADTTVTLQVGPVPVPSAPVQVCIVQTDVPGGLQTCQATPPASNVTLDVTVALATPSPVVVPPTAVPVPCPPGTAGVAAQVFSGSASTVLSGSVTVVLNGGAPLTVPVSQVVLGGGQTLTLYACAGLAPGVPLPGIPALPV